MDNDYKPGQVVFTNKARCRDCNRCVRVCPVKAIRMEHGQAYVEEGRCIACGTCIRECPQGAKQFRNDTERAVRLISQGGAVAASIAPSFAVLFSEWERRRLPSALRKLGFSYVGETSIGAYHVAHETARAAAGAPDRPHVGSACPAVVRYIERYKPELVDALVPVCSPMVAHAKLIKQKLGQEAKVVFIGPCVSKKAESDRPENRDVVDCALTFRELSEWFDKDGISLAECEESDFDEEPQGDARFFPLEGGSIKAAALDTDLLGTENIAVSGVDGVRQVLDNIAEAPRHVLVEPLFCSLGCIGGPAIPEDRNVYERRRELLDFAREHVGAPVAVETSPGLLQAHFNAALAESEEEVTEHQIREVLAMTGKFTAEDELNCGACGYSSCRDKATAVVRGLAEPEMCIPYMRRLAEQRTDRIIETSPNGIVIVDTDLHIIHMNAAFRRFFMCSEAVIGRHISYLMDPDAFEKLAAGDEEVIETVVKHDRYKLMCHQIMYALREDKQYVGIFVNITHSRTSQRKLSELRTNTLKQAQELMEHQITMAQQMARFLGESTAQGERLVENLMELAGEETEADTAERPGGLPWDTYTSR